MTIFTVQEKFNRQYYIVYDHSSREGAEHIQRVHNLVSVMVWWVLLFESVIQLHFYAHKANTTQRWLDGGQFTGI